jgi:hypothetical protein
MAKAIHRSGLAACLLACLAGCGPSAQVKSCEEGLASIQAYIEAMVAKPGTNALEISTNEGDGWKVRLIAYSAEDLDLFKDGTLDSWMRNGKHTSPDADPTFLNRPVNLFNEVANLDVAKPRCKVKGVTSTASTDTITMTGTDSVPDFRWRFLRGVSAPQRPSV